MSEQLVSTEKEATEQSAERCKESLYRTRWLIAHNRLHDIVYKKTPVDEKFFEQYLAELRASGEIASRPA